MSILFFIINALVLYSFINCMIEAEHKFKPSFKQYMLDNNHDVQLLRAVQSSMHDWKSQQHHQRKKRATKRVCYDELGCFEDSGPFSYLEMLPSHPEEINTKFNFYSTRNRSESPLLELPFINMASAFESYNKRNSNESKVENKTIHPKSPITLNDIDGFDELSVRVIVHGFGSACAHVWIYEMKTALMAVENCIVICVDWSNGAILPNYVKAATNTRLVGKQLAILLSNLQKHKGLNLSRTHIIGFSLGAHVAGFAGAELPGLSRITGLDPAGPLFETQHPTARLDNTDAKFVDVIHSNGENLILGGLGSWQAMGHVDFYPNGGRVQKGCSNLFVGAVTDFIWSQAAEVEGRSLCNHRRAYKFFIDSVAQRCLFPAFPCDNYESFLAGNCFACKHSDIEVDNSTSRCGNMGYYANLSNGRGQLYLLTREEEPFCAHQFKLEIFNAFHDMSLKTIGKIEATLEGEGGLNETFLITEREDTEFFAGDVISKIIAPHPALGFPGSLTLQYKSYSGWLSKGLSHWDIDRIVLTDSFGRSHSMCMSLLSLSSGNPEKIYLKPGKCQFSDAKTSQVTTDSTVTKRQQNVENYEFIHNRNDSNQPKRIAGKDNKYPVEVPDENAVEKYAEESSRSLNSMSSEIFEPILKNVATNKGRNFQVYDDVIKEPILNSSMLKSKRKTRLKFRNYSSENMDARVTDMEPISVQIFPLRLGELLQMAERYAKETILPLISVQAPKFFGFNPKENERIPRYIPRYDESFKNINVDENINQFSYNRLNTKNNVDTDNFVNSKQKQIQNTVGGNTDQFISPLIYARKIDDVFNYDLNIRKNVFIELPTYRPVFSQQIETETSRLLTN